MFSENQLRDFDVFIDAIRTRVQQFPIENQHCLLQCITEGEKLHYCLVRLGVEQKKNHREHSNYGKFQLWTESFSTDEFLSRLSELTASNTFLVADTPLALNVSRFWVGNRFFPSHSEYHDWPGYLCELGETDVRYLSTLPLVSGGLTPYFDARDVVVNWIGVPVRDANNGVGKLQFFLPHFEARLDNMTFADGVLEVSATVRNPNLHLAILAADSTETLRSATHLTDVQSAKIMAEPERLKVSIVNSEAEILDDFSETPLGASRERVIFAGAAYPSDLMEMIRHGETDKVEFKEFIRLDNKEKKGDIVKAVISFANTTGGTILVGVADNAEILGVDGHTPNDDDKAATFVSDYFRGVRDLLKQRLNRVPQVEMHAERLGDKTIFIFQVEEGAAKPYFNIQTKEVFLRRGANDVRPDPDSDLKSMLCVEQNSLGADGWNQNPF